MKNCHVLVTLLLGSSPGGNSELARVCPVLVPSPKSTTARGETMWRDREGGHDGRKLQQNTTGRIPAIS